MILPPEALPLLEAFGPLSTLPSYRCFVVLLLATILTQGRHTVANLLRTVGELAPGHRTDYQRVLSRAPWSGLRAGCTLARLILDRLCPNGPVFLVGDDTVDGHPGRCVYGKARHRDPVRSSHAYTAWKYGHCWVVLAVLVRLPGTSRPWALPVLVDLYRSEEDDRRRGRPHRTPARLMCRLLRALMMEFPGRRFVFVGDSGYGSHEVACLCHRHRARLSLVSKLHPEANLFDPAPPYGGAGRPRVKGARRPKPREGVEAARRRRRITVGWYGGGRRRVEVVTGSGHWYKAGEGLVPIRWVFVHDREGTHRDEYFYTTDPAMGAGEVVTRYAGRWNLECTFQEGRAHLHSESTRGWSRRTVLRATPCLLGLYSVVTLLYDALPAPARVGGIDWPGKESVTFSDALCAVRLRLWSEGLFREAGFDSGLEKLPTPLRELLCRALAPAA
ncbi:IS701 family transposase [Singulisphaera sp. PoT]|uniref:IS701 family transposase n=1 Tax=Singulisphaera sp. PoT TaxID=3411797 RepID=UPI003BF50701